MRIRMLHDVVDSPDYGMNMYAYEAEQVYTTSHPLDYASHPQPMSEELAARCIERGWAEDADAVSGEVASPESVAAAPVEPPQASDPPAHSEPAENESEPTATENENEQQPHNT